jgi:hypothetical protein
LDETLYAAEVSIVTLTLCGAPKQVAEQRRSQTSGVLHISPTGRSSFW